MVSWEQIGIQPQKVKAHKNQLLFDKMVLRNANRYDDNYNFDNNKDNVDIN